MPNKVNIKEAKEIKPNLKLPLNKSWELGAFMNIFSLKGKRDRDRRAKG